MHDGKVGINEPPAWQVVMVESPLELCSVSQNGVSSGAAAGCRGSAGIL